jgi:putative transposase
LAVGTVLQVLQTLMAEDVARLVGPKGRHNPDRMAVRHGSEPGQVTLGGRRVRTTDGSRELPVPTYQVFAATDLLGQLALERMLAKLSCRRYPAGLEPVGGQVEATASGTSKSRSRAGSSRPPNMPWPNCWPGCASGAWRSPASSWS